MANIWSAVRQYLPPVNFITMHHAYFIFVGLLFAIIFWGVSHPSRSISFTDSLFLVESAFTGSGLNTINISQLTTGQQIILVLMMVLGSPVLIALFTVGFRVYIFEKRFEDIVELERSRGKKTTGAIVGMAGFMFGTPVLSSFRRGKGRVRAGLTRKGTDLRAQKAEADKFQLGGRDPEADVPVPGHLQPIQEGHGLTVEEPVTSGRRLSCNTQASQATWRRPFSRDDGRTSLSEGFDFGAFISNNKKSIGRNGQFYDLTDEERIRLGGVEYRSLRILFVIITVYFVVFQVLGAVALGAWMSVHSSGIAAVNSQNPWWAGVFLGISSFNNAGMTLLDAGIAAFDGDAFVLTVVTILALGGCYAFPAFVRMTVFVCSWLLRCWDRDDEWKEWKEAFDFILKYPRRLFMMMFPAKANWTFVAICTSLGAVNWVMLLVLSIGNPALEVFPVAKRVGLALFQALSEWQFHSSQRPTMSFASTDFGFHCATAIPSGGFTVVSASGLWFDIQVLWVVMMYVAAYPEIIVMRNSNVSGVVPMGMNCNLGPSEV